MELLTVWKDIKILIIYFLNLILHELEPYLSYEPLNYPASRRALSTEQMSKMFAHAISKFTFYFPKSLEETTGQLFLSLKLQCFDCWLIAFSEKYYSCPLPFYSLIFCQHLLQILTWNSETIIDKEIVLLVCFI